MAKSKLSSAQERLKIHFPTYLQQIKNKTISTIQSKHLLPRNRWTGKRIYNKFTSTRSSGSEIVFSSSTCTPSSRNCREQMHAIALEVGGKTLLLSDHHIYIDQTIVFSHKFNYEKIFSRISTRPCNFQRHQTKDKQVVQPIC